MARCRKMLERKHIGKIEAIPAAVSLDFSNAFAPKRLRQMAVPYFGFRVKLMNGGLSIAPTGAQTVTCPERRPRVWTLLATA